MVRIRHSAPRVVHLRKQQEGLDEVRAPREDPRPLRLEIVGIGATPAIEALADVPEVEVIGAGGGRDFSDSMSIPGNIRC